MAGEPIRETVLVELDPRSIAQIATALEKSLNAPIQAATKTARILSDTLGKQMKETIGKLHGPAAMVANDFKNMNREALNFTQEFSADATGLINQFKKMNLAMQEVVAGINLVKEQGRRASIETTTRQTDANRLAVEEIRAKSKANFAASQKEEILAKTTAATQIQASKEASRQSLLETRISAQRRAQIHKQLFTQIRAIEKSLGTIIKTTYQDASKVISKAFSGLGTIGSGIAASLRKHRSAVTGEMQEMTSSVVKNSTKMNTELTSGVNAALNKRERLLRSSFAQQERILTTSAIRQQAAMTKMRASVSTGVLGGLTGRGVGMGLGAFVGGVGIAAGLKAGFTEAVNLNEQLNKTAVLFGDSQQAVVDFSKTSVTTIGATSAAALQAAGSFGNIFRGAEIGEEQAAQMSVRMTQLAADLSSFNNVPVEDVFTAISAGLVGEMEPLRRLGVVLNDAELRQRSFLQGTSDGKSVLNASARAQAAYSLILEKTTLAQGDYARTAKEGANAIRTAGQAMKQFLASVMRPLVPVVATVAVGLTAMFQALTLGMESTNPLLHEFRRAMFGAAAGMLAVIAAKGVIEVFKLMAAALKLVATPLGTMLVVAGLVGAAIALMVDHSDALRGTLGTLGDRFVDVGKKVAFHLQPVLKSIGDFIDTTVIPAIDRLAQWLADKLIGAFDATVRFVEDTLIPGLKNAARFIAEMATLGFNAVVNFIRDKAIPAFESFVGFLQDEVYPILVDVGRWFQSAFDTAWGAIEDFWAKAQPVLQPAIDGFQALGSAIGAALSGDFSQVGAGVGAVASGFAETFANIGKIVVDMLSTAWDSIQAWLETTFSGDNLVRFAKGFLDLVERVGYILGHIASHPAFLAAVAAVGAAAAIVAIRFTEGVVRGLASNLPTLVAILGAGLVLAVTEAIKFAFSSPVVVAAVALGIMALLRVKSMFTAFQAAGANAGEGFLAGFRKSVMTSAHRGGDFLGAMIGGPGLVTQKYFEGLNKAFNQEKAKLQAGLRALGSTIVVDPRNFEDAKRKFAELSKGLSQAQINGLLFRDSMKQGLGVAKALGSAGAAGAKAFLQGLSAIPKGIASVFKTTGWTSSVTENAKTAGWKFTGAFSDQMRASGRQIRDAFRSMTTSLAMYAEVNGTSIGKTLMHAIGKGLLGAAAVVGGFVAGQAEGASGGSGLISALLGGVTVAAMIPGGWGTAVGVLTGGAALIGAAFGKAKKEAREFREELKRLTTTFTDELVKAIEAGVIAVQGMDLNIDFTKVVSLGDLRETIKKSISDKLSGGAVDAMLAAGIDLNAVVDMLEQANGDINKFDKTFGDMMVNATANTQAFGDAFGTAAPKVAQMMRDLVAPGGMKTVDEMIASLNRANLSGKNTDLINMLWANKKMLDNIVKSVTNVTDESAIIIQAYLDAQKKASLLADKPMPTPLFGPSRLPEQLKGFDPNVFVKGILDATTAAHDLFIELANTGMTVDEITKAFDQVGMAIPPDLQTRIDAWDTALGRVKTRTDQIKSALEGMPGLFASAIVAAANVGPATTVDEAVVDAPSLVSAVATAIDKGSESGIGKAELRIAQSAIAATLSSLIAEGVAKGAITDEATARTQMEPYRLAMIEALGPKPDDPVLAGKWQAQADAVATIFNEGLTGLQPTIDTEQAMLEGQRFQGLMQEFLTNNPLTTEVQATFWLNMGQTGVGVLQEGDMRRFGSVPGSKGLDIIKRMLPTAAEAQSAAAPTGAAITRGIGTGLLNEAALSYTVGQAVKVAQKVNTAIKDTLGIKSPSKVMAEVGVNLAKGLALGMEQGISTATTAAAKLAQASLDAASEVLGGGVQFGGASPSSFVNSFGQASGSTSTTGGSTSTSVFNEGSSAPFVGQITIMETANAQQTARSVVTELRTEALLARRRP